MPTASPPSGNSGGSGQQADAEGTTDPGCDPQRVAAFAVEQVVHRALESAAQRYDQLLWSVAMSDLSADDAMAVTEAVHPAVDVSVGVFVLGHVIGTVLLGLAMLRSGTVPAWSGWAVAVSQPLHFLATVILGSPEVDFIAWCLTALGMAMVARALLKRAPRH